MSMNLQVERYQVKRLLGQGAMGKVYLAHDPKLDRKVAIKVLNTSGNNDPNMRKRFVLEARAIAALKHPNIVELYDYSGAEAPDLYLVMEYVPGLSLYQLLSDRGMMSEPTALCVGHELALALEVAHRHQVVHRDIKPENILLYNGRVVLTDFGVVKAIARDNALGVSRVETRTLVLGTPGFMAPEQFAGRNLDARTDIFATGAVLYNLVTGKLPFAGEGVDDVVDRIKRHRYTDPRGHNPVLSVPFCELLARCLAPRPKDRLASATQLKERILHLLAIHGVSEVRKELEEYEKNPAAHAAEQRERGLDVLFRDLKVALKDRDENKARALIQRIEILAPVDERMFDISGVRFDSRQRPRLARDRARANGASTVVAALLGILIGALAATFVISYRLLPDTWLAALARLSEPL
ncbi:MAG: serine/threonine protein kinase [Deltaproteobacteria bacterium]|nr:serine/threonine protein kinase [Deltaproteobacteria bacterium]